MTCLDMVRGGRCEQAWEVSIAPVKSYIQHVFKVRVLKTKAHCHCKTTHVIYVSNAWHHAMQFATNRKRAGIRTSENAH